VGPELQLGNSTQRFDLQPWRSCRNQDSRQRHRHHARRERKNVQSVTGEGTGLGLSISHDIIVKQHAGSIEVDTQPGEFTEIRVTLPRTAALLPKQS
jgi:signal transduction histidine kinase